MTVVIFICRSVVVCRRDPAENPRIFLDVMIGEKILLRVVAGPVRDIKLKNVLGETRRTDLASPPIYSAVRPTVYS